MVRFFPNSIRKAETIKDLQASALQSISLATEDLGVSLVDDPSVNTTVSHPCRGHQPAPKLVCLSDRKQTFSLPGWPGTNYQS
jgi:hypothetical protein